MSSFGLQVCGVPYNSSAPRALKYTTLLDSPDMASANASTTALFSSSTTSLDSLLDDALHVQLAKLNRWGARLRKKYAKLSPGEVPWRGRYVWLRERGYQLRSRYSPDWKASWLENGTDWSLTAEDGGKFPYSVSGAATA